MKKARLLLAMVIILVNVISINMVQVNANSKYGRLTGVNWFGFETGNACVHGLWARDYKSMLQQIKDMGFNCIRLPWSVDVLNATPNSIQINAYGVDAYTGQMGLNADLAGLNSMQVMDKIIDYAGTLGLKIILDCHSLVHDGYAGEPLWYSGTVPESAWINAWKTIITRYKDRTNVIGADLKNEPHGNLGQGQKPPATWGFDCPGYTNTNWKAAVERCGQAILAINPNIVVIAEGPEMAEDQSGYWWGGNLKDVKKYPETVIPSTNFEYSMHEYGSGVFMQTWFTDPTFPNNMASIWDDHFYYIQKEGIGQLLMGEFGITEANASNTSSIDYKWLTTLMSYVGKNVDFTFWSWNPDSGDTGGILKDDWATVNTAKYNIIKPYLAGNTNNNTPTPTPSTATPTPTPSTATNTPTPTPSTATNTPTPTPSGATATPTPSMATPTPTPSGTTPPGGIKVQFFNGNTAASTNSLYPNFKVVNTGTSAVNLSDVKVRYYFTNDGTQADSYACDWATVGNGNITSTFATIAKTNADRYLEVGFTSGAGSLAAGAGTEVKGRLWKSDWSNFTQTNDYSFNATATNYVDSTTVTGYMAGALKWGTEP